MIIELEVNGARVIISGENLTVNVTEDRPAHREAAGHKLCDYLGAHGIKPTEFARTVGVPASTITRIIRRERGVGSDLFRKINRAAGGVFTVDDFVMVSE